MPVLGLDTSNYTTSVALFDGQSGENIGRLLDVRPGELGLRQSDALFQHVKRLPELLEGLLGERRDIRAVGASTRPRAVEGSYMPCFLAGESQGRRPLLRPLPSAGTPGRRRLVRRTDRSAGRALPGLAPVRRNHGIAADQTGGSLRCS